MLNQSKNPAVSPELEKAVAAAREVLGDSASAEAALDAALPHIREQFAKGIRDLRKSLALSTMDIDGVLLNGAYNSAIDDAAYLIAGAISE